MPANPITPAPPVTPEIRPLPREDSSALLDIDQWAFIDEEAERDPTPALDALEWDRTFGAWLTQPERLAGVYAAYSLDLTVPGGSVPCAGLTWVGVHPQDRRRGVLTAMMRHHLRSVVDRGTEPVGALWAAETAIYGRFGYGLASRNLWLTVPRGAELRDVPGTDRLRVRMERVNPDVHADLIRSCYAASLPLRPGNVSRRRAEVTRAVLDDQLATHRGVEGMRVLLVEDLDTGRIRGYALFRRKAHWGDGGGPDGTVTVHESVVLDAAAARVLWGRLSDLDLMAKTVTDQQPPDCELLHLLVDPRGAAPNLTDNLWVRLLDVPAALSARRYAHPVDVTFAVRDPYLPENEGSWRLTGGPDGASCVRTEQDPDLTLDVRELGAAYLGGETLSALAAAGLVEVNRPAALVPAATAFMSPTAPNCRWMF